jgi:hypothetical protein
MSYHPQLFVFSVVVSFFLVKSKFELIKYNFFLLLLSFLVNLFRCRDELIHQTMRVER